MAKIELTTEELTGLIVTKIQQGTSTPSTSNQLQDRSNVHPAVSQLCLIRSYASGVHIGLVDQITDSISGKEVKLLNSYRIWSWTGALSCSEIAIDGITGGKISICTPVIWINRTEEIIPATVKAWDSIKNLSKTK